MEKSILQTLLSINNFADNTWIRPTDLHSVILTTTGNQFFNPQLQKIRFNSTNEVLEIKYSELVPCTSLLGNFSYNYDKKTIYISTYGSVYYGKKIREPKIGDKVGVYDPKLKTYIYSEISKITYDVGKTILEMKDTNVVNKIKNATYGLRFFVVLGDVENAVTLSTPTEFYVEKNVSSYTADIFISYDNITGIEFNKTWC